MGAQLHSINIYLSKTNSNISTANFAILISFSSLKVSGCSWIWKIQQNHNTSERGLTVSRVEHEELLSVAEPHFIPRCQDLF